MPILALGACAAGGQLFGELGVGLTAAGLAAIAIATVGADIWPTRQGRHALQVVAVLAAGAIVAATYLRGAALRDPAAPARDTTPDLRGKP